MIHYRPSRILPLALWLLILLISCGWSWGPRDVVGPDVRAGMLIYFKQETREEDIGRFWNLVLSTPDPRGGYQLLPGISGLMGGGTVQGHQSMRVDFWTDATQEQRDEIKARVLASPLVYRVLENTIPSSVTQLD